MNFGVKKSHTDTSNSRSEFDVNLKSQKTSDSDMPGRLIGDNEQGSQVHNVLSQEVLLDVEQAILVYQTPQIPLVQFPLASSTARVKLRRDQC